MGGQIYGPDVEGAALGIPEGTKVNLSADFRDTLILGLIENKGLRLAWSRAAVCPCQSVDGQTRASDPNCPLCQLTPGFIYFRPDGYDATQVAQVGKIDAIQKWLIDRPLSPAVVIRGIITSVARQESAFDRLGDWVFGAFNVTTRHENKLGYYDRLTCLDTVMSYSQIITITSKAGPIEARFPVTKISMLRDVSTEYHEGEDFELDEIGRIVFLPGRRPPVRTRLSAHYNHHPQFLVAEHVHAFRSSVKKTKVPLEERDTDQGTAQPLPIQTIAKLEFLLGQGSP